jgi:hypothetical protein
VTGPEHYLEAERLLAMCVDSDGYPPPAAEPALDAYMRLAQVHATLALAAATALGFETDGGPTWSFVAGKPLPSGKDDEL